MAYGVNVATGAEGNDFATLIRNARERRGWSQEKLAEESGVGRRTIIRWETRQIVQPEPEHLNAVIRTLGISREDAARSLGWLPPTDRPTPMTLDELREAVRAQTDMAPEAKRAIESIIDMAERQRAERERDPLAG